MPILKAFYKPKTLEEAAELLQQPGKTVWPYAGGTALVPRLDGSIDAVLDLSELGLAGIVSKADGLHLGAMTTLQTIIDSSLTAPFAGGFLAGSARRSEPYPQREQVTLGGVLFAGRCSHPLLTALLALDAEIEIYKGDSPHKLAMAGFFAYRQKLASEKTLITGVRLPPLTEGVTYTFHAVGRTPLDEPIVCVAAGMALKDSVGGHIRLAVGGAHPVPLRLGETERRLEHQVLSASAVAAALEAGLQELRPAGDYRGSVEYRREMAHVLSLRALRELAGLQ